MVSSEIPLSVTIIARNEEQVLPRCLESLPKGCEIIVVDSNSSDATLAVAAAFGAKTYTNSFTNYAEQKNFAIDHATRDWVLSIDADEVLSPELSEALVALCKANPTKPAMYTLTRQLVFMGRLMRYGRTVDYPIRLFTRGHARFKGEIHERLVATSVNTSPQSLRSGVLFHYSYKNLNDYFTKFNRYTTLMAEQRLQRGVRHVAMLPLCLRPPIIFFYRYIWCLGALDGYPGFVWSLLASVYSFVKYAKLKELLLQEGRMR